MTNSIDNIFAIKDDGGKNTNKKSTTNSFLNNNNKEGCSPLDPRCWYKYHIFWRILEEPEEDTYQYL